MKWISLLLIAFSCKAQVPVMPFQPPGSGLPDISGVVYWWVASDLPTNTAVVSWVDRISGSIWTNGASTSRPTNSTQGVWLDVSHWLTNNSLDKMGSNFALAFICDIKDLTFFQGVNHAMIIYSQNGGALVLRLGADTSLANNRMAMTTGADGQIPLGQLAPFRNTNAPIDLVFNQTVTNGNKWGMAYYTNGVLENKLNFTSDSSYMGTTDLTVNNPTYFRFIGGLFSDGGPKMFMKEIWMWTNGAPGDVNGAPLPTKSLSDFHRYAKLLYGVTP